MAHHGSNPLEGFNNENLKKMFESNDVFKKSMSAEQAHRIDDKLKSNPMLGAFGATGNFQDGKLTETDEGEIMVGITTVEGRVILNFGKAIRWIGLTKEQAKEIGEILIKRSL